MWLVKSIHSGKIMSRCETLEQAEESARKLNINFGKKFIIEYSA